MYLLLTVNYLECGIFFPHLKNLSRFIDFIDSFPPSFFIDHFLSQGRKFSSTREKSGLCWAFLGWQGEFIGWNLKQEINQWIFIYLQKTSRFFPWEMCYLVGPWPREVTPMRWDLSPNPLSVASCQCRDKLLFPQRLFDFFHDPPHFPAPSFPHLDELLVALDVLT